MVVDGLEALLAQHDELGRGRVAQGACQARHLADLGTVDQHDAVAGRKRRLEHRVDRAHLPVVAGGDRLETERLEGLELAAQALAPEAENGSGGEEQKRNPGALRKRAKGERQIMLLTSLARSTFHAIAAPRRNASSPLFAVG